MVRTPSVSNGSLNPKPTCNPNPQAEYLMCFLFRKIYPNYSTLPKTNIAPENGWLEDEISCWVPAYFQGWYVSFREGNSEPQPRFPPFPLRLGSRGTSLRWSGSSRFLCCFTRVGLEGTWALKRNLDILLMEKILHHLGCIKLCKQWDIYHISWCRSSAINSTSQVLDSPENYWTSLDITNLNTNVRVLFSR